MNTEISPYHPDDRDAVIDVMVRAGLFTSEEIPFLSAVLDTHARG